MSSQIRHGGRTCGLQHIVAEKEGNHALLAGKADWYISQMDILYSRDFNQYYPKSPDYYKGIVVHKSGHPMEQSSLTSVVVSWPTLCGMMIVANIYRRDL